MTTALVVGDLAELVRSKNAGPFWQTIDIFFSTVDSYRAVADNASLDAHAIARLYGVDADDVRIWRLPDLRVVKISFPRPTIQGGRLDRDMHAGQQHVPLSALRLAPRDH
jgi:hypothetical protein